MQLRTNFAASALTAIVVVLATTTSCCTGMVVKNPPPITTNTAASPTTTTTTTTAANKENNKWSPFSWRSKKSVQIPVYPDEDALNKVEQRLAKSAPLVFAGEVRSLQEQLALASQGKTFVLFGGDCAESFDEFSVDHIRDTFRVILQMSLILTQGGSKPVVKIGRMAGTFCSVVEYLCDVLCRVVFSRLSFFLALSNEDPSYWSCHKTNSN